MLPDLPLLYIILARFQESVYRSFVDPEVGTCILTVCRTTESFVLSNAKTLPPGGRLQC